MAIFFLAKLRHIGPKFCTKSFFTKSYNFDFIKIFVGGRFEGWLATTRKTTWSSPRPALCSVHLNTPVLPVSECPPSTRPPSSPRRGPRPWPPPSSPTQRPPSQARVWWAGRAGGSCPGPRASCSRRTPPGPRPDWGRGGRRTSRSRRFPLAAPSSGYLDSNSFCTCLQQVYLLVAFVVFQIAHKPALLLCSFNIWNLDSFSKFLSASEKAPRKSKG